MKTSMDKDEIKKARMALKLTQLQLAEELCTNVVSISRWENGAARPMKTYVKQIQNLLEKNGSKIG